MEFDLEPKNKHIVIETISQDDTTKSAGGLYLVSRSEPQYGLARVIAVASDLEPSGSISVGDTVLYDLIGSVNHRIGTRTVTTVKALNVISVVRERVTS